MSTNLLVSFKFLVSIEHQIIESNGCQQKILFGPKEGHRLESLDAILLLPLAKVPCEVVVNDAGEHQQAAQECDEVDRGENGHKDFEQHFLGNFRTGSSKTKPSLFNTL